LNESLILLAAGAGAGMLAGLLGIGGGIIVVPVLLPVFLAQGVSGEVVMQLAIGTSLATMSLTSLSSARAHHRRGAVSWPVVWRIAPGVVAGGLLGAAIAEFLAARTLYLLFSALMIAIGVEFIVGDKSRARRGLPGGAGLTGAGLAIGTVAALMGIGGGSMMVPLFTWCGMPVRNAVGTSAAVGFPIALSGTLGFVWAGRGAAGLPPLTLGYVSGPALAGIVVASVLCAPLGARLAHAVPERVLRGVFGAFLVVVGVRMLLKVPL